MSNPAQSSPFHDLDAFAALPRMSGLTMSPDGTQLVVAVSTPDQKSHRYASALWRVDPLGEHPAVRLTRGAEGESSAAFTNTGDLLFTAKRPDPESVRTGRRSSPRSGSCRPVRARPGWRRAGRAALPASSPPQRRRWWWLWPRSSGATDLAADEALRKSRKDAGISAILHDGYPVRFWDHDLGPDRPHLLAGELPLSADGRVEFRDLTPAPAVRCSSRART